MKEIKKEIFDQIDCLFKNEKLSSDSSIIEVSRDIMKRIIRLDSYVQKSNIAVSNYSSTNSFNTKSKEVKSYEFSSLNYLKVPSSSNSIVSCCSKANLNT